MKQLPKTPLQPTSAPSLADFFTAGIGVFLRRPWMALIPLLFDVLLLATPRITPEPLVRSLQALGSWIAARAEIAPDLGMTALAASDVRRGAVALPLHTLFQIVPVPVPGDATWAAPSWLVMLGIIAALNLAGLSGGVVLLAGLGPRPLGGLGGIVRAWGRLLQVALLLTGASLLLGVPLIASAIALLGAAPVAVQLMTSVAVAGIVAMWIMATWSLEAIVIGRAGVLQALYQSYNLTRLNLSAALGLLLSTWVLAHGLGLLLRPLLSTPWGIGLALVLYGALSVTIAAARMTFYQNRIARLERTVPIALA